MERVYSNHGPPAAAPTIQPMKRWRVWLVLALVALLVVGHGIDIAGQREHWPFSHYPMYARAEKKKRQELLSLFGTMRAPGYRAVVRIDRPQLRPAAERGPPARDPHGRVPARDNGEEPRRRASTCMADYMRHVRVAPRRGAARRAAHDGGPPLPADVEAAAGRDARLARRGSASRC